MAMAPESKLETLKPGEQCWGNRDGMQTMDDSEVKVEVEIQVSKVEV